MSLNIARLVLPDSDLKSCLNPLIQAGPVANDLVNLREALFSLDPEQDYLYSALDNESARVKQAVADAEKGILELRAELDALWSDERECEYELSSVFMHRGTSVPSFPPPFWLILPALLGQAPPALGKSAEEAICLLRKCLLTLCRQTLLAVSAQSTRCS